MSAIYKMMFVLVSLNSVHALEGGTAYVKFEALCDEIPHREVNERISVQGIRACGVRMGQFIGEPVITLLNCDDELNIGSWKAVQKFTCW